MYGAKNLCMRVEEQNNQGLIKKKVVEEQM